MKKAIIALAILLCAAFTQAGETNFVMKAGGTASIARYLPLLNKYPKIESSEVALTKPMLTGVAMWRVGDGVLRVSITFGAGIIRDINYAVPSDGKKTVFKVKAFNIETGEMTIMVPNNGPEFTGAPPAAERPETHP